MVEKLRVFLDEKEKELYEKIDEVINREKWFLLIYGGIDESKKFVVIFFLDFIFSCKII